MLRTPPLFTPTKDGVRRGHCLGGLADAVEIGLGRKPVGGMVELEVKASLADHRLSPAVACLLRVVMHACMLGACLANLAHDKVIRRCFQQHDPLTGPIPSGMLKLTEEPGFSRGECPWLSTPRACYTPGHPWMRKARCVLVAVCRVEGIERQKLG